MRYLVRARVKPGCEAALLEAIEVGTLGQGSVAEGEYLRNMDDARLCPDETARWVEVCYCRTPLQEERPYWEQYFDLTRTRMTAGDARTRTAASPGPVEDVIAPSVWSGSWRRWAGRSSTLSGA